MRDAMDAKVLKDKIMGCWLGKNAGGTLGEPLEEKYGKKEMFSIDWYPSLPEGGIPNDDLELQLIFLQVLLEKGPGLTSADLIQEWLDCVNYNFDEYGLSKANMMLGLMPPVCGWHNNAFKDCMGSPIRSELWACIAPGNPDLAAHYAFMDAVCDHGGGESVYGEIYNAVVQSLAFVEHDRLTLIRKGLSAIPASSLTRRCIERVVQVYESHVDWKQARNVVMEEFYHPIAQYAPLNLGFQTIGWLYGQDFGDAMCKAVNCGWDTDCTAATLGATLGIIQGASGLPEKWIKPLGYTITTNMRTGGIKNLSAPTDIRVLTDLVYEQAEKVARYWGRESVVHGNKHTADSSLLQIEHKGYETYRPNSIKYSEQGLEVCILYQDDAALLAERPSRVAVEVVNTGKVAYTLQVLLMLPSGISVQSTTQKLQVIPNVPAVVSLVIKADAEAIKSRNEIHLMLRAPGRTALHSIPIVLAGGYRWAVSRVYPKSLLDTPTEVPEDVVFSSLQPYFAERWFPTNAMENPCGKHAASGVQYLLHYVQVPREMDVVLGFPNTNRMRLYVNAQQVHETTVVRPLRPNMGNGGALGDLSNYKVVTLHAGWNQILVKWEIASSEEQAHFVMGSIDPACVKNHGGLVLDAIRTQFPW